MREGRPRPDYRNTDHRSVFGMGNQVPMSMQCPVRTEPAREKPES